MRVYLFAFHFGFFCIFFAFFGVFALLVIRSAGRSDGGVTIAEQVILSFASVVVFEEFAREPSASLLYVQNLKPNHAMEK